MIVEDCKPVDKPIDKKYLDIMEKRPHQEGDERLGYAFLPEGMVLLFADRRKRFPDPLPVTLSYVGEITRHGPVISVILDVAGSTVERLFNPADEQQRYFLEVLARQQTTSLQVYNAKGEMTASRSWEQTKMQREELIALLQKSLVNLSYLGRFRKQVDWEKATAEYLASAF